VKTKYELEVQLQRAAQNMKQARVVGEQIRLASEPEPQTTGGIGGNVPVGNAPSFTQGKR